MTREQLIAAVDARIAQMRAALANLADEVAVDVTTLFEQWEPDHVYVVGDRIRYGEKLYRVVQAHTSQVDWTPDVTPALFTEIPKPGEIPEWKQPTGAQDAYSKGDKVLHNGSVWESTIDGNVWEPGVYGWTIIN